MSQPNQAYVSKGVPYGGLYVEVFRLADVEDNDSGVSLGTYLLESITPQRSAVIGKRPDTDGGKNGWWMVNGDTEGSAVFQRNVETTPTLQNGDYFEAAIRVNDAGAGVSERFVIHTPAHQVDAGYRKQNVSVIVDDQA